MNTRSLTVSILVSVIKDGRSLTVALDTTLALVTSASERAFIQALSYGVMRDYHTLDFILSQLLPKPIRRKDTDIKILILMGIHQLRSMRVKPHAAVAETVAAVGKKTWAKAVLNAVLRNYLREQESLESQLLHQQVAKFSHPEWIIKFLQSDWESQAEAIMQANNQPAPMVLRVNQQYSSVAEYENLLVAENILATAMPLVSGAIKLQQAVAVEKLPKFTDGWISVQDSAAQLAALVLNVQANMRVLDVCAAPGGKTAAILEQHPSVEMLAIDVSSKRMQRLADNLQRLNLTATTLVADACQPETWWDGKLFERILIDAPCSALGVIRRHPDIKFLRRADDIETLCILQAQILDAMWGLLTVGGVLVYATCSVLKAENETQILQFLARHANSFEIPIDAEWGLQQQVGRQILPGVDSMDGFYYARIGKR